MIANTICILPMSQFLYPSQFSPQALDSYIQLPHQHLHWDVYKALQILFSVLETIRGV